MESFKKQTAALWRKTRYVVNHRVFAGFLMCAVTLTMALHVSVNTRVVTVNDGEDSRVVVTMHDDPYRVLDMAGVELETGDEVAVDADVIDVERAKVVEVKADGLSTLLYMTEGTVKDALNQADVKVGKLDTLNHKKSAAIKDGMTIEVDRVAYEEYKVTKSIDYEVEYKYTGALRPGQSQVRTYGKEGQRTITYRKLIVNGKVVDTEKVSEKVTKKPVNKVILKGTKVGTPISKAPFNIELDEGGQPVKYKKVLTGQCTAYTSDCGDSGSYTATGKRTAVGLVAVDPRVIPYGTKMWITSADGKVVYGYAIAADTGSALRSGRVLADLYMDTLPECNAFGRRNMKVYILE